MSAIHICQSSDANLLPYIPTVWKSIMHYNSHHTLLFHFLHDIIDEKLLNDFTTNFKAIFPTVILNTYLIDFNNVYINRRCKHVSVATMYRLYIPSLLRIKKVLYLDIDILVMNDLQHIWNLDCGEKGLAMKSSICKSFKLQNGHKAANAGVILMDLDTLRKYNFTKLLLTDNQKNPRDDQLLINDYAEGKYTELPSTANCFVRQDDNASQIKGHIIIYHFAGKSKLWDNDTIQQDKYKQLWNSYKNISVPYSLSNKDTTSVGILTNSTANLGDWTQTAASLYCWWVFFNKPNTFKQFLTTCIKTSYMNNFKITWIDRDTISNAVKPEGIENVILLCNAWWLHKKNGVFNFPPPYWIKPIYLSTHITSSSILTPATIAHFKTLMPIGCRDVATSTLLEQNGVRAYFTGCLTMTLNLHDPKLGFTRTNEFLNKVVNIDCRTKDPNVVKLTQVHDRFRDKNLIIKSVQDLVNYLNANEICTTRLHVWLPLKCNNANVTLINKITKKKFVVGANVDYNQVNRFSGLDNILLNQSALDIPIFINTLLNKVIYEVNTAMKNYI